MKAKSRDNRLERGEFQHRLAGRPLLGVGNAVEDHFERDQRPVSAKRLQRAPDAARLNGPHILSDRSWIVPDRPGCSQFAPPGTIGSACHRAPEAARPRECIGLGVERVRHGRAGRSGRPIAFLRSKTVTQPGTLLSADSRLIALEDLSDFEHAQSQAAVDVLAGTAATSPGSMLGASRTGRRRSGGEPISAVRRLPIRPPVSR